MDQPTTARANHSDLDAWIEKVEAMGQLKRITAEVDQNLEAATLSYLVGREGGPALLFKNPVGHDVPVATNLFGRPERVDIAFPGLDELGRTLRND